MAETAGPLRCFVFTDIEGSTRAWETAAGEMDERLVRHDSILRDTFARHGGTVFSTGGDGFAVVFDDVGDAVVSALEVQAALAGEPLRVRMGIHVGRAVERDGDYFGPTLNRAARLMAVGHGGQVLLSDAAGALARSELPEGVALVDLGTHQLRDLTRPEHIWQLQTGDTAAFPALRSVGAVATNLPVLDELVGREVDTVRVVELARSHRLVTITGPGGVGKSSLALAVAQELAGDAADGTWLVELAPLADGSGLIGAVAGVLPLPGMATSAAGLLDLIGPRRMLVILDNCEHLVDDVAVLVSALLLACPGVRLLCTSQEALAVDREHVWLLQPLDELSAVALFGERARSVRPDVADAPDAVAEIVRRLDGLPLAIELAAARASTLSIGEIAARLDDRFVLLSGRTRGRQPRHRALAAMVEWSHDVLEPDQQRLFRRLGVFAGSFSQAAALDVANLEGMSPVELTDGLDDVVRRSLVVADVSGDETRFRLLETLKLYALERLAEAGEADTVARRHAEWYADRLGDSDAALDETRMLARGVAEFDNVRTAVTFALDRSDTDLGVRLVAAIWRLVQLDRFELLDWARQVMELPGAPDHPFAGYVYLVIAHLASRIGRTDESELASDEALRRPLDETAWTGAVAAKAVALAYREGRADEHFALLHDALARVSLPENRILLQCLLVGNEPYGGRSGVDRKQLIVDADALGRPQLRALARSVVGVASIVCERSPDGVDLLVGALAIAEGTEGRMVSNSATEMLLLATGIVTHPALPSDVSEIAARTLDLTAEYPGAMGYGVLGLMMKAHRDNRSADAATLAGYLAAHLGDLLLHPQAAEFMAGGPLEGFVSPATRPEFAHGQAMNAADLRRELERLAGRA